MGTRQELLKELNVVHKAVAVHIYARNDTGDSFPVHRITSRDFISVFDESENSRSRAQITVARYHEHF